MVNLKKIGAATAAALLLVTANVATSQAFHTGESYDSLELKCRSTIAKTFTKAIQSGQKLVDGCNKTRNKSGGAADCNVIDLANADPKGKMTKSKQKIVDGIQKSCIDTGVGLDIVEEYISCPEPCTTNLGLPNPLASFAQVGQCLGCYATEIAQDFGVATQGVPTAPMASATDQSCHSSIGKGFGKYLATILKERTKCQNTAEKEGELHIDDTGCLTADPKLKIAAALTKANEGIDSSCATAALANLDSCSNVDLAGLKSCLASEAVASSDAGVAGSYELEATICPSSIDGLVRARNTLSGAVTATRLELGWSGLAHNADLQDNYFISADVSCANAAPPCGSCTIDGISASGSQYNSFLRCRNDVSVECDELFANDLDDCGGDFCTYVLGPPLPVSSGNNPTCAINRLATDITGTSDPDTGEGQLNISLSTLVNLGVNGLTQPCAICVNDTTPLDGTRTGTCVGGARNGLSCDIQGYSLSFAPQNTCAAGSALGNACVDDTDCPGSVCALTNGLSLDCAPGALANISGSGLNINLELTTGASSLSFSNQCDAPLNFLQCACGQCSGDGGLACRDDAECLGAGAGTCTNIGAGITRQPNGCNDFVCTGIGGGKGTCLAGPSDSFCDGVVDADGKGYVQCFSEGDCDIVDSVCGGDCGDCTLTQQRACFLDPIVATGTPSTENPVLVSTFCLPPTSNAAINGVTGSPGPTRVTVDQLTQLRY